ncbi:MAG: hypothetical protein KC766_29245, partial [Myxococcales bacterium]|nr:hypothetical protein [Myxococcales bacterium]
MKSLTWFGVLALSTSVGLMTACGGDSESDTGSGGSGGSGGGSGGASGGSGGSSAGSGGTGGSSA